MRLLQTHGRISVMAALLWREPTVPETVADPHKKAAGSKRALQVWMYV
jgi:hypothetical protein